jgi:hypothetical protein
MAEGGCLCGAVRYRLEGPPLHGDHCHDPCQGHLARPPGRS